MTVSRCCGQLLCGIRCNPAYEVQLWLKRLLTSATLNFDKSSRFMGGPSVSIGVWTWCRVWISSLMCLPVPGSRRCQVHMLDEPIKIDFQSLLDVRGGEHSKTAAWVATASNRTFYYDVVREPITFDPDGIRSGCVFSLCRNRDAEWPSVAKEIGEHCLRVSKRSTIMENHSYL